MENGQKEGMGGLEGGKSSRGDAEARRGGATKNAKDAKGNGGGRVAEAVGALLGGRRGGAAREESEAWAPANIALVKYWGKRDETLKLPVTDSLSVSLGTLGTRTRLRAVDGGGTRVWLNGQELAEDSGFTRRLGGFLDAVRAATGLGGLEVRTENNIPTAAGLASSASGFAALAKALDALCGWKLDGRELSVLARLGSGSASRSVFEGFVRWRAGERADGLDSFAEPLKGARMDRLRIGAVVVREAAKAVSSGDGMRRTVESSPFYAAWPGVVARDLAAALAAIKAGDVAALGEVAERNALAMHATMATAWPPLVYAEPETLAVLREVWRARAEGLGVWFTMDAGPNVKLLFDAADVAAVRERFAGVRVIEPFGA